MNEPCLARASGPAGLKAAGPSIASVPTTRSRWWRERSQPRGARPAEYRRPAARLDGSRCFSGSDNEHPRAGYRTAEPSDSPPRASRYASGRHSGAPAPTRSPQPCRRQPTPPNSGYPHPPTLFSVAAERRPSSRKGVDCRRHAAACPTCVSGWGSPASLATGRITRHQKPPYAQLPTLPAPRARPQLASA